MSRGGFPEGHKTLSQLHAEEAALAIEKQLREAAEACEKEERHIRSAQETIRKRKEQAKAEAYVDTDAARVLKRLEDPSSEFISSSPE